jgi:hypothetical protein
VTGTDVISPSRRAAFGASVVGIGLLVAVVGGGSASAATAPVGLGTAGAFAVMGASTVTNTGFSVISGSLGVSPGTAVTGFPPGVVLNGSIHAADATAGQAQQDITTAYNDVAGRPVTAAVTADLAGQTLLPGVYDGGTLSLTGTLTLDAQSDAGAVFILRAASTLTTASASRVLLTAGTNPCGVFWLVGSSAALGTGSTLVGTVLAQTAITAGTGADVTGRLLARTAAVTLDDTKVRLPTCTSAAAPSASPTSAPTATASATTTASPTGSAAPTRSPAPTGGSGPTGGAAPSGTSTAGTPSAGPTPQTPRATGTAADGSGRGGSAPLAAPGVALVGPAASTSSTAVLAMTGTPLGDTVRLGLGLVGIGILLASAPGLRRRP